MIDYFWRVNPSCPASSCRSGDSNLGLVVGDAATAAASGYLIPRAAGVGASRRVLMRMVANVLVDMGIGAMPPIGDLFDLTNKANRRNIALLKHQLNAVTARERRRTRPRAIAASEPPRRAA